MEPLFPEIPEDLADVSREEAQRLLAESEAAVDRIVAEDKDFLGDLSADDVIAQMEAGVAGIGRLREHIAAEEVAYENFKTKVGELATSSKAEDEPEPEPEPSDPESEPEEEKLEVVAEVENTDEPEDKEGVEVGVTDDGAKVLVTASVVPAVRYNRTPPPPAPERVVVTEEKQEGPALVAAGGYRGDYPDALTPMSFAELQRQAALEYGPLPHKDPRGTHVTKVQTGDRQHFSDGRIVDTGREVDLVWDGPKVKTAGVTIDFPGERTLTGGEDDIDKIRAALPEYVSFLGGKGGHGGEALVASGGLCAPLTPIYTMPNFGSEAEPVWDALPVFRAARGGVNVPAATYVGDITTAISSISEEDDALGGTFATKSCQALVCPDYTETAVQILAHCREYGNLNARAWPEKIAHENAITMQALSRTSEGFMLDRIKALSINVTSGADTLGAVIYLVNALKLSMYGIRSRLRMPNGARFRALLPAVILDMIELDVVSTPFDRWRDADSFIAYLRSIRVDPVFYMDTPSTGESQIADAAQAAGAVDGFPDEIQAAIYPEGAFLGIDSGTLELGIVRDSTLNSTNDFQVFGERFRNVALLGPDESAHWHTINLCPIGEFPPAGTARTCESA